MSERPGHRRHPQTRDTGAAMDQSEAWMPPTVQGEFQAAFGASIIEEFVAGHTPADVLRELIANTYDAGGTRLAAYFGGHMLSVTNNGNVIDDEDLARLRLLLGTGRVIGQPGAAQTIQPKKNSIGSKNFGLRSLFLFGDRIHVRSDGKLVVLDLAALGTLLQPDPSSHGRRGVAL